MASLATHAAPRLAGRGITKRFGGETALADVDFELAAGEVHGVVGTNGAGKSTLMKILAGALPDHEGQIEIDGAAVALSSPQAALAQGVAMVYQELSGIGQLSVAENVCLGRQPVTRVGRVDWKRIYGEADEFLGELGLKIDTRERLDRYPLSTRQLVEIARALHRRARVLILDEPTSALSPPETKRLFELIRHLRGRGLSVIFISHFIEDVLEVCDRVTVVKDGRKLWTRRASELTKHEVIHAMLGHELAQAERGYESAVSLPPATTAAPRLVCRRLTRATAFADIALQVSPGECLGLYGFVGAGHQELAHALAGALPIDSGDIEVDDRRLKPNDTRAAVGRGVVLVAADRKQTLVQGAAVYKNVTLAHLGRCAGQWLTTKRETTVAAPLLNAVGCRPADPLLPAGQLSGGNQQKVVLAKWLAGPIRVLVLDEPTRGMDVAAKDDVMRLVQDLKKNGAAVVLSSSEPELLLDHADRILVMKRGRIARAFAGQLIDKATLIREA